MISEDLPDQSFDVVTSTLAAHHIPDGERATAAGFRGEARGELPVLRYIRAVRPLGTAQTT